MKEKREKTWKKTKKEVSSLHFPIFCFFFHKLKMEKNLTNANYIPDESRKQKEKIQNASSNLKRRTMGCSKFMMIYLILTVGSSSTCVSCVLLQTCSSSFNSMSFANVLLFNSMGVWSFFGLFLLQIIWMAFWVLCIFYSSLVVFAFSFLIFTYMSRLVSSSAQRILRIWSDLPGHGPSPKALFK